MRIAVATAQGLATGLDLPLRGVGTLEALGRGIGEAAPERARLAVLDGFRGEVFAALYSNRDEVLWEAQVYRPEALVERIAQLGAVPSVAGLGAVRFRHELERGGVHVPEDADPVNRVAARQICAIAAAAAEAAPVAPIYLRPPDAERWRERDSFPRAK